MNNDQTTVTFAAPKEVGNAKLRAITERSVASLYSLMADHEEEVLHALHESEDGRATFNHAIKIDFGKNSQTDKLSFSLKHGDEITNEIPDPDQGELFAGREEDDR